MNNKFDEYIKDQRKVLDVENPDDDLIWRGINEKLPRKKLSFKALKIAATIVLLVALSVTITLIVKPSQTSILTLASLSPELAHEEISFIQIIDQKFKEIEESNIDQESYAPFFEELKMLDKLNSEALKDLNSGPVNPRLIQTLLRYYEQKIRILEQLLNEIEKNKYYENKVIEI